MTEFVEHWVDGKLKLVPKGKVGAARTTPTPAPVSGEPKGADVPAPPAEFCSPVSTGPGNVVGAPDVGVPRARKHPWVEAVYERAHEVRRKLFEREDARSVTDL